METPAEKAQINFTEPELSIMKTANKGWDCCGNAQASVADGCQIILACEVTAECNDKRQAEPMAQATRGQLDQAGMAPAADETGERPLIPAVLDTGYFSESAVAAPGACGFRSLHRDGAAATPRCDQRRGVGAGGCARDSQREDAGEAEDDRGPRVYARRKAIVEPVFGQIKERGAFAGFCCVAWTRSAANGGWCA